MNDDKIDLVTRLVERTGKSLFLTGKAGTGKTTFLRNLRTTSRKRMVVTAPTGIAAINAGGVTLHSFFQLDFGPFVPGATKSSSRRNMAFSKEKIRIIRGLDLLVIDEVSMVRADVLDAVDAVLRRFRDRTLPFGGVQLLLIGDLQQLPPVVVDSEREIMRKHYNSPYFFDSHALQGLDYITVELTKVYRQDDESFIRLLNAVRENKADESILRQLNSRYIPGFNPADGEGYVRLTTHNRFADEINRQRLEALPSEPHVFEAKIEGNFPESSYPADPYLTLKEGAQVMFIKNDTGADRKFYNGMLGTVTGIDEEDGVSVLPVDGAFPIHVEPAVWENVKFTVNEETNEITEKKDGSFTQLPLKPAWAITIHKSQGLTFDKAMIDASMSFSHGQTYVALSRCRSIEGLVLERPLQHSAIITDPTVSEFIKTHNTVEALNESNLSSLSHAYFMHLIYEMFNFKPLFSMLEGVVRLLKENFMRIFPEQVIGISNKIEGLRISMQDVSAKFQQQLATIDEKGNYSESNELLLKRIKDASAYFLKQLREVIDLVASFPSDHDNKTVRQKLEDRLEMFANAAAIKETLLDNFSNEDFSLERYLDIKAKGAFREVVKKKRKKDVVEIKSQYSNDNIHPELFDSLCVWRRNKADEINAPAFVVASTKTLLAVANYTPRTYEDLIMLPGIGPAMVKKYGDDLLSLVDAYIDSSDPESLEILPIPVSKKKKRKL